MLLAYTVAGISPWRRSAAQASWQREIWQHYNACPQHVSWRGRRQRLDHGYRQYFVALKMA